MLIQNFFFYDFQLTLNQRMRNWVFKRFVFFYTFRSKQTSSVMIHHNRINLIKIANIWFYSKTFDLISLGWLNIKFSCFNDFTQFNEFFPLTFVCLLVCCVRYFIVKNYMNLNHESSDRKEKLVVQLIHVWCELLTSIMCRLPVITH